MGWVDVKKKAREQIGIMFIIFLFEDLKRVRNIGYFI